MPTEPDYDPRYLQGIEYFNACEFFEAHDEWEALWADYHGPSREFYKGLIQAAVCLHHFGNGNIRGAKKLYFGARGYLEKYGELHEGVRLDAFLNQLEACCAEILASADEYPSIEIVPDLIPEIHLEPAD